MPSLRVMEENERLQLSLSIPFFITAGHSQGITKPLMSFCKRRPSRWRLFTRLSVHDARRYPTSCNVMSNVKDHVCGNTALGAFSSVHEEDGDVKMPINRTICRKKKMLTYSQAALVNQCLHTTTTTKPYFAIDGCEQELKAASRGRGLPVCSQSPSACSPRMLSLDISSTLITINSC